MSTASRSVQQSSKQQPQDGGLTGWLNVFAVFCVFMNTWGLPNSFGVFQSYYGQYLLSNSSASQISWIGTVQSFFVLFGSLYAGPLYDYGYLRSLIIAGSFLLIFGTMMNSLCYEYWQILLSQGFFIGFGLSCLFIPTPAIVSTYFKEKRSMAIGVTTCGSAVAGVVYPIIVANLIPKIGFGWTVRVLGFIYLLLQIPVILILRPRTKAAGVRRVFSSEPWRESPYLIWSFVYFFSFIGLYVPYFYVQLQAEQLGLVTGELNFYLLPILNGSGIVGRLVSGYFGDKIGPMTSYGLSIAACTVLLFAQVAVNSSDAVIAYCALYGLFSGAVVGLFPTVVAVSLTPNLKELPVRWTMMTIPPAIGLLIGNPIAGAVLVRGGYSALQYTAGASMAIATVFAIFARAKKIGWKIRGKC